LRLQHDPESATTARRLPTLQSRQTGAARRCPEALLLLGNLAHPTISTMHPSTLAVAALIPLVLWRVYSRVRRLVGRQRSRLWRHRSNALVFPVLLGLLGLGALGDARSLTGLGCGMLVGIGLACLGLRLTRFEVTAEGAYFTPYPPIGIGLSAVFIARLGYRVIEMLQSGTGQSGALRTLGATPLTLLVFGTLASYLTVYAVGMLRWRRRIASAAAPAGARERGQAEDSGA
jgi:hypothetical protein